jgi:hypothetical protein
MSQPSDIGTVSVAPPSAGPPRVLRWVCTSNPFYVLSAGLFLAGLWISFGGQTQAEEAWALMTGLASYTLLLAVTAFLLVRFCKVWNDVRTILLLVVLMFLATSVTFDEVLVLTPRRGYACYLTGLLFAILVSEGLLRGIRLALPAWFRAPYYLLLALFFLYPLALSPLVTRPRSEELMWGLFGFSSAAGLIFLTLLPAIRRGPSYVRNNGSPWQWPLYPWVLFGVFGIAVPGRAFLLCWSMHLLGLGQRDQVIFGPYFLVPFGLAVAVVILEIGKVSNKRQVLWTALAVPAGLVVLVLVGNRPDPIYREFLAMFIGRLGGTPLFLALVAAAGYYGYAACRRVPLATEALTAVLALLAFVAPNTLRLDELVAPRPGPILAAAVLQLALGLWQRAPWRCLLGAGGLATVVALAIPEGTEMSPFRDLIVFHLVVLALLIVGAVCSEPLGQLLRGLGAALVLLACVAVTFGEMRRAPTLPPGVIGAYPLLMASILAAYGRLLGHKGPVAVAVLVVASWFAAVGGRAYASWREVVAGLDYLVLSLTLFALAVLISLGKSGVLSRRIAPRDGEVPRA